MTEDLLCLKPNPYLVELDSYKKKKGKLAHEYGEGAPCLNCNHDCPGFELHFWRKICRNCRCSKDDHDVKEEEELPGMLRVGKLFDRPIRSFDDEIKYSHGMDLEMIYKKEGSIQVKKLCFDWIPPGVTKRLAAQYMSALSRVNQPIKGTEGAKNRKKQLNVQLPPHDLDMDICSHLSAEEKRCMEEYVAKLKREVIGQGVVFLYRDIPCYVEDREAIALISEMVSSGMAIGHDAKYSKLLGASDNFEGSGDGRKHEATKEHYNRPFHSSSLENSSHRDPSYSVSLHGHRSNTERALQHHQNVKESLEMQSKGRDTQSGCLVTEVRGDVKYHVAGSEPVQHTVYHTGKSDRIADPSLCDSNMALQDQDHCSQEGKAVRANRMHSCLGCNGLLKPGDVAVCAQRLGWDSFYHPDCFACDTCKQLLVDLIYFHLDGKVYCGRHYAEAAGVPRCLACDELIWTKQYTLAETSKWHVNHFCCWVCDEPLGGEKYVMHELQPYGINCYTQRYGKKCGSCGKIISAEDRRIVLKDTSWHQTEECFRCVICKKNLLGGSLTHRDDNLLCSRECLAKYIQNSTIQ